MLTKGPVKGFPCLAPSLSLGNVLFTVTQSWKTFFLKGALRAQTHRQPGSRPSRFPPQQRCQGCFAKKDKIAGSHVWANQTTLAGHLSTTRFVRAKTGWRPFLPFRSEWGAVGNTPCLPTRISGMGTEHRRSSRGGNQVMQGTGSVFPRIRQRSSPSSRTQRRRLCGPGGHPLSNV